jgi:hypothetical protein
MRVFMGSRPGRTGAGRRGCRPGRQLPAASIASPLRLHLHHQHRPPPPTHTHTPPLAKCLFPSFFACVASSMRRCGSESGGAERDQRQTHTAPRALRVRDPRREAQRWERPRWPRLLLMQQEHRHRQRRRRPGELPARLSFVAARQRSPRSLRLPRAQRVNHSV